MFMLHTPWVGTLRFMTQPRVDLGDFLQVVRHARGLSRREVAGQMGVQYPFLANIENGDRRVPERHIATLAQALGLQVDNMTDLVNAAEADRRSSGHTQLLSVAIDRTISLLIPDLSEQGRAEVLGFQSRFRAALAAPPAPEDDDLAVLISVARDLKKPALQRLLAYAQGLRDAVASETK